MERCRIKNLGRKGGNTTKKKNREKSIKEKKRDWGGKKKTGHIRTILREKTATTRGRGHVRYPSKSIATDSKVNIRPKSYILKKGNRKESYDLERCVRESIVSERKK